MIDHISIGIADVESAKKFYKAALEPLGYAIGFEGDWGAGFKSKQGAPDFWIRPEEKPITPVHVAFQTEDRALVNAFYEAALAAGGKDNGAPGLRPHYHENYYGAFVLDADGHNIEAVCHKPEA
ncbi:MAG: VOC family protein [Gaiellaceae bacterium]|jgi:catechol 2,3-dioxygenase-like lactoylglutathione lyase family enzyme